MKLLILVALHCALLCGAADRPAPHRAAIAPSSAGDSDATSTHSQHKPRTLDDDLRLFNDFIREHGRTYQGEEKQRRFQIFQQTLDNIDRLNANSKHAVFGITRFADMTREEFIQFTGYKSRAPNSTTCDLKHSKDVPNVEVPKSLDFRTKGIVTPVKNQAGCGSCWAFATTGNLEGLYAMKHKKLVSLSEQQMLDCGQIQCPNGWWVDEAMIFLHKKMAGIMSEVDYPYTSNNGEIGDCKFNDSAVVANVKGCEMWRLNKNEELLKKVLFNRGPLTISIDGGILQSYIGGLIDRGDCEASVVNHAVLIVGYGVVEDEPYWIVKNSWGISWGEHGYFRMRLGVNCLNLMDPEYAEIVNGVIE